MTKEQAQVVEQALVIPADIKTTSGKIRWLAGQGKQRGEIAKLLNIRYQHVRNVLVQPLKQAK